MLRFPTALLALASSAFPIVAGAQTSSGAPALPSTIKIGSFASHGSDRTQTKIPQKVQFGYLEGLNARKRFERESRVAPKSMRALAAMGTNGSGNAVASSSQTRLDTLPYWTGSFTYQGTTYPYYMVGRNPRRGDTTRIHTSLIPVSLIFDEFLDAQGNNITIDVTPVVKPVINSPNFENASYSSGYTQFGDAVQRAEFWDVKRPDWHTLLHKPHMLTPVQIEVPVGAAQVYQFPDGTTAAVLDKNFFYSQLNTIAQLEHLEDDEIPIVLANNTFLADANGCCVLGFHTAFENLEPNNTTAIQVFAFATWVQPGILTSPDVEDVLPLSHEISETLNDPFISNVVPPWQKPDGSGLCGGSLLETGDPIEGLATPGYPVTVDGYTYHPQTEALLQWFSGQSPSSAINQAYSYPDTTVLTQPAQACVTPAP